MTKVLIPSRTLGSVSDLVGRLGSYGFKRLSRARATESSPQYVVTEASDEFLRRLVRVLPPALQWLQALLAAGQRELERRQQFDRRLHRRQGAEWPREELPPA